MYITEEFAQDSNWVKIERVPKLLIPITRDQPLGH